jgi:cyanophycin synthetase
LDNPFHRLDKVPVTFGGLADFQVANALAATAACRALAVPTATIADALKTFSTQNQNLGRMTMYRLKEGCALLDYGHNPEAIRSVLKFIQRCPATRLTGVLSLPGDRADSFIREAARIAGNGFHRLIIYEDEDRRGRAEGEVPRLIFDTVTAYSSGNDTRIALKWSEAVQAALDEMIPGEFVVIFCDRLHAVESLLLQRGAVAVGTPGQGLAPMKCAPL